MVCRPEVRSRLVRVGHHDPVDPPTGIVHRDSDPGQLLFGGRRRATESIVAAAAGVSPR